jgi:hypothetical protein
MTAHQPTATARPARPATGPWLAFSAALTAQVPPVAGRDDLTVTCTPGVGHGAPACFLPAYAHIEVDGTHLGVDPATADPARSTDRDRYPALWGATIHECAHAAHTRWTPPPAAQAAWVQAALQLEESRIEAAQLTRRPGDRRWLRACAQTLVVKDFTAAAAPPASSAEAGSAAALILARHDASVLEAAECAPVEQAVTVTIGAAKLDALRTVWRTAQATADTDARTMLTLGRRWCRILGIAPDQPAPTAGPGQATPGQATPGQATPGPGQASAPSPVAAAVAAAAAAISAATADDFAPPPAAPPGQAAQRAAEQAARQAAGRAAAGVFTRDPDGVASAPVAGTRDPSEAELAAARRLARTLRAASAGHRATTVTTSATPPGRLHMRQAMAGTAQRAAGALPTAQPFTRTQRRRVPAPPVKVGIACDVSGSIRPYAGPVASAAWILARAAAAIPAATTASLTYGRRVRPLVYPGTTPRQVPVFSCTDCYEDITGAIDALDGALGLSQRGAVRLLIIVSDGDYKDTQYADGQRRITRLAATGCTIVWIAPDDPRSNPMKHTRALTLADPAATTEAIATAITRALPAA